MRARGWRHSLLVVLEHRQAACTATVGLAAETHAQMTKWLGIGDGDLPESWQWKLRGVADSLRLSPFRLNYWTPPGLLDVVRPPQKDVMGKVVSDAMEAIIGVFYEALGPAKNSCWLACLGLIPGAPTVRARAQESKGHARRCRPCAPGPLLSFLPSLAVLLRACHSRLSHAALPARVVRTNRAAA